MSTAKWQNIAGSKKFFTENPITNRRFRIRENMCEHIPRQHICHNIVFMPSFNESSIDWQISFIDSVELSQF